MNKNDKFHGAEFEVSAQAISDEQLESVSGGGSLDINEIDLKAFWAIGGQGIPTCMQPLHGGEQVAMKSYWKDGKVHLECTECGFIRVI